MCACVETLCAVPGVQQKGFISLYLTELMTKPFDLDDQASVPIWHGHRFYALLRE